MKKKFIDVSIEKDAGEERTYNFIASTDSRDREGDVIVQSGWKLGPFKKNPVILWAHSYTQPPVGKAVSVELLDGKLKIKVQFASDINPFAAMIEEMVAQKFLNAVSVGFSVYKTEELTDNEKKERPNMQWGRRLFGELLEVSIVPVPANADALGTREFQELCVRGFRGQIATAGELIVPALKYAEDGGAVNPRKLKACFAVLFGARGGVSLPDNDRKSAYNHLARVAREAEIEVPEFKIYTEEEIRSFAGDVWHDEVLEIVEASLSEEDRRTVPLLKGERRAAAERIVKDLTTLLGATEEESVQAFNVESGMEGKLVELASSMTKNLSEIQLRLRK